MRSEVAPRVGIAGGTGALGGGIAARLATAGVPVALSSRDADRGAATAAELADEIGAPVTGGAADVLADVDVVVLAVPYEALAANLTAMAPYVAGKIVVSAVNPMAFDADGPYSVPVEEGSAALAVAAALPEARVAAAFHAVASRVLRELETPMDEDVPVFAGDVDTAEEVIDLVNRITGCRGLYAGPLRLAGVLESLTPVLITMNRRYRAHAGVRFSRVET